MRPRWRSDQATIHRATRVRPTSPIRSRASSASSKQTSAATWSPASACVIPRLLSSEASQSRARGSVEARATSRARCRLTASDSSGRHHQRDHVQGVDVQLVEPGVLPPAGPPPRSDGRAAPGSPDERRRRPRSSATRTATSPVAPPGRRRPPRRAARAPRRTSPAGRVRGPPASARRHGRRRPRRRRPRAAAARSGGVVEVPEGARVDHRRPSCRGHAGRVVLLGPVEAGSRPPRTACPTPCRSDLAYPATSAKMVRLLRRVAGVRHRLNPESRLLEVISAGVRPHRTRRPDRPDEPSGATNNCRTSGPRVAPEPCTTRPTAGVGGGGEQQAGTLTRGGSRRDLHVALPGDGTVRDQREEDERDLWRDRRSASGSRPMTTR